jgi:hypothetical protein
MCNRNALLSADSVDLDGQSYLIGASEPMGIEAIPARALHRTPATR